MKKEINELLKCKNGYIRINRITRLRRWQEDALGDKVDRLEVVFDNPTGSVSFFSKDIKSREFKDIVAEIEDATREFLQTWQQEVISEIHNGRIIHPDVVKIENNTEAGAKLRELRMLKEITQQNLADAAEISIKTLQDYESGRKDVTKAAAITIKKLAEVLGCQMEDLTD